MLSLCKIILLLILMQLLQFTAKQCWFINSNTCPFSLKTLKLLKLSLFVTEQDLLVVKVISVLFIYWQNPGSKLIPRVSLIIHFFILNRSMLWTAMWSPGRGLSATLIYLHLDISGAGPWRPCWSVVTVSAGQSVLPGSWLR